MRALVVIVTAAVTPGVMFYRCLIEFFYWSIWSKYFVFVVKVFKAERYKHK